MASAFLFVAAYVLLVLAVPDDLPPYVVLPLIAAVVAFVVIEANFRRAAMGQRKAPTPPAVDRDRKPCFND